MSYRAVTVYISGSLAMQARARVVRQKLIGRIDAPASRLVVSAGNFVNCANGSPRMYMCVCVCGDARNARGFVRIDIKSDVALRDSPEDDVAGGRRCRGRGLIVNFPDGIREDRSSRSLEKEGICDCNCAMK